MKQITDRSIISYEAHDGFRVDIVESPNFYSAWLYHKRNGVKALMFGVPKRQNGFTTTREEFLQMVEDALPEYMEDYESEYPEEEPLT